ncbi:MAG: outer membrane protein transport protein [Ignavibacteriaceae bacterium]|nr:outer membrane protein transport protein [Ignavibacteriaceae bacterium]
MKKILSSIVLLISLSSFTFGQNGTRLIGFDALSMGRGGTSIGTFDSPELMMTNPAGISFLNNSVVNLDMSLMFPTLHFKNTLNDVAGDKNTFPLPGLTYVNKYPNSKFTWGVGAFTSGGMGADFSLKNALYRNQDGSYNLQQYHSQLASMQGGITLAYMFNDQFSVGTSLHLVYSTLEFSMPYSLDPSIMKGIAQPGMTFGQMFAAPQSAGGFGYDEVTATSSMTGLTGIGFNGKIGFAYKPTDKLSLGLSYTLPTSLTYKNGKATMDMTQQLNNAFGLAVQGYMQQNPGATQQQAQGAVMTQFGQMGIDLSKGVIANYDLNVDLAFPQSLGFGASYAANYLLQFGLDIEWLNWAKAFDKMTLKLSNGNNSNINTMLGNTGAFSLDFPMNWKNSVIVKVGGEFKATNLLTLRLGYVYGGNPVPESTIFPVFPAIVDQRVTAGGSYKISAPLTINAAIEMALNKSLTASNPSLIANEYNGSTSQLSTILVHLSLTYNL